MANAPLSSADHQAVRIDGQAIAAEIGAQIAEEARRLEASTGIRPGLAVVLVGDNPASQVYVANKGRRAEALGFHSIQHSLPADAGEDAVLQLIDRLNRDAAIHGILVQLPLPAHLDKQVVIEAIHPTKDVDGLHPINAGRLAAGLSTAMVPCTPAGVMILLRRVVGDDLSGRSAMVIGRSNLVGRPLANLLVNADCTVTLAHSKTRDLAGLTRQADIVIAAVGRPEMVRGSWIKPGATVIDVGVNRVDAPELGAAKTRLVGDVAFAEAMVVAAAVTPVPGGVGPMTVIMLMANTVRAARRAAERFDAAAR